jgi:hypothetical protein
VQLNKEQNMKNRARIRIVFASVFIAVWLAQVGCSGQNTGNTATTQPSASPSPENAAALTTAAPAPGAPAADTAGNATGTAPTYPTGSANPPAPGLAAGSVPSQPPAPPRTFTLAAGAPITIYTAETLSTKNDQEGERFTASLGRAIVDGDWVIARKGAPVEGVILNSDPGGRVKGRASMTVALRSLTLADGSTINLATSSYTKVAKGTKKKDAMKIGIGAGIGAAIGAIAGGGKGAAIGAGAGGGAGTGYVLATRGDPAVIPSESALTFKLKAPVTVTKR